MIFLIKMIDFFSPLDKDLRDILVFLQATPVRSGRKDKRIESRKNQNDYIYFLTDGNKATE